MDKHLGNDISGQRHIKISLVGTGRLGSVISYLIADRGIADELVLIDMNRAGAEGQMLDLKHSFFKSGRKPTITVGDYPQAAGSDIVIITAGKPRTAQMTSRAELLLENSKIIKSIAKEIKTYCNGAVLITTTNPTDAINTILWKETGFVRNKIIGFGGLLDSGRLKSIISDEFDIPLDSINCIVLGEHGENMVPLFSGIKVDGKAIKMSEDEKNKIRKQLLEIAKEVISKKGATEYGPASNLVRIVEAIAGDKKEVLPCSCILQGEYGINDVSVGIPAMIDAQGMKNVAIITMDSDEEARLKQAADKIKVDVETVLQG